MFLTIKEIVLDNPLMNDYILSGGDGLVEAENLPQHKVVVDLAMVMGNTLGTVKKWIYHCSVFEGDVDVSMGYKIIIVCDSDDYKDTWITVDPKIIEISVECAPSEYIPGVTEYEVLDSFFMGETIEISVQDGRYVYEIKAPNGTNRNQYYEVIFNYPGKENNEKEAEYASRI